AGGRAPAPARAGEGRASHGTRDGKPADRPAHAGRNENRPQQNHRRPEGTARPAQGRPAGGPRAALLSK
ncbi:MAG: RNA helicase, partial [Achromobacter sp.]|nr:RNA helicase [Achromobacter sp.]